MIKKSWKKYKIEQLIIPVKESVDIDINEKYKQVKVRLDHKGVELRKIIKGAEIGSKQYLAKEGQFIISKIDARNRAMGIIPYELNNAIVTNDFPLFEFSELVDKNFFNYYSKMPLFDKVIKSASEGTTNRRRLKLDKFYNLEKLPQLPEQKRIVKIIKSVEAKQRIINELNEEQERDVKSFLFSYFEDLKEKYFTKPLSKAIEIDIDAEEVNSTSGKLNCRDSSKFKACSPHQVRHNLKENSSEIASKTYHHSHEQ